VLFAPKLQMMIRKWYETTPKGYPPRSQLHLPNGYLDNIVDNSLVLTNGRTWEKTLAGNIMIMNDNAYGINFYGNWRRSKEPEFNRDGLPFGGTTHETMDVGSSFNIISEVSVLYRNNPASTLVISR